MTTKTVVGDAITVGDTIILPLVDVSFGMGATAKAEGVKSGGGGGIGGKMTPSAVLVIKDGATKLVNIKNQDSMTKILDMVPDFVNKFISGSDADPQRKQKQRNKKERQQPEPARSWQRRELFSFCQSMKSQEKAAYTVGKKHLGRE